MSDADDHSFTETSSKSPVAGEIATDSSINGTVASQVCDVNPPQTGYRPTMRGLIMMPPEEKLKHFNRRAQDLESSQQIDACIQDLVRCAALTRLVHGDGLELAKAHARLADVYLHSKGWPAQAQEHSSLARELLPFCCPASTASEDRLQVLTCLLCILLTQGGAACLTADFEEAESSYLKAERIVEELHRQGGITQEEKIKNELEIATFLSRVYRRQARPEEALDQCERSLQLLEGKGGKPKEICSVYKDMAAIEQARGHLDQAIQHLSKAHAIAVSQSPGGPDGAHISHSLALVHSGAAEPHHNEAAAHYFEESLSAYRSCVGPHDVAFLTAQDDYCHFLLLNGQQERCVEMQRSSVAPKRSAFGDLSGEVADTLQLIGGVEMTQGRIKEAHKTLRKCLEIQNIMYGPQHKKTKATQNTVDMLARAPGVAGRRQKQGSGKTRPASCAALPANGKEGKVPSLTLE